VLILDEPTAVLTPQEVKDLFVTLRRMVAEGHLLIFISHKLHEVLTISDRVTVLRAGRVVFSGPLDDRWILPRLEQLARILLSVGSGGCAQQKSKQRHGNAMLTGTHDAKVLPNVAETPDRFQNASASSPW
jgi:ABC-type uncharacterized transport system ATPase subunit